MPIIRHHLIGREPPAGLCQQRQTCCERNGMDCNQGRLCPERQPMKINPNGLIAQFLRLMRGLK